MRARRIDHGGRCALEHDLAAVAAAVWSQIDHPVGVCDDIEVVLDHDHRAGALVDQAVQHVEQARDIAGVQADRRLVQDIDHTLAMQVSGQLDPLAFAAGQAAERLSQPEAIEADVDDGAQDRRYRAVAGKELQCLAGCHLQDVADCLGVEVVGEDVVGEPATGLR